MLLKGWSSFFKYMSSTSDLVFLFPHLPTSPGKTFWMLPVKSTQRKKGRGKKAQNWAPFLTLRLDCNYSFNSVRLDGTFYWSGLWNAWPQAHCSGDLHGAHSRARRRKRGWRSDHTSTSASGDHTYSSHAKTLHFTEKMPSDVSNNLAVTQRHLHGC